MRGQIEQIEKDLREIASVIQKVKKLSIEEQTSRFNLFTNAELIRIIEIGGNYPQLQRQCAKELSERMLTSSNPSVETASDVITQQTIDPFAFTYTGKYGVYWLKSILKPGAAIPVGRLEPLKTHFISAIRKFEDRQGWCDSLAFILGYLTAAGFGKYIDLGDNKQD